MNEEMLRQYARLVIHIGVNLQKGQPLVIASPVDCAFLTTYKFRGSNAQNLVTDIVNKSNLC